MGDKQLMWKWLQIMVIGLLLTGLMAMGCSEDDEDPVTPSRGDDPPADFQGNWYLYARQAVGDQALQQGISPLLSVDFDSAGAWSMYINESRQRHGDAYWRTDGDETWLDLYQIVYEEEKLYKSVKIVSYETNQAVWQWPATPSDVDTVETPDTLWTMARGGNMVFGFVSDGFNDHAPMTDVTIEVHPYDIPDSVIATFQPDGDGFFMQEQIEPVMYSLEADGFDKKEIYVTPSQVRPGFAIFRMTPPVVGTVTGVVTDMQTDEPIADAAVWADDGTETTTDAEGVYSMDVHVGQHIVYAEHEDYYRGQTLLNIREGREHIADFELQTLPTTGTLIGTVYNVDTERTIGNVSVTINDTLAITTLAEGVFSRVLPGGDHILRFEHEDYHTKVETVTVELGVQNRIDFYMSYLMATVSGLVTNGLTEEPIGSVLVTSSEGDSTYTDVAGLYSFELLPGDDRIVAVEKENYFTTSTQFDADPDGVYQKDFEILPIPANMDTLIYDDNYFPTGYAYIPNGMLGNRMTANGTAELIEVWMLLFNEGSDPQFGLVVMDYPDPEGQGVPQVELYSEHHWGVQQPEWTRINLQREQIEVQDHFYIAMEDVNQTSYLAYNDIVGNDRCVVYDPYHQNGPWLLYSGLTVAIRALVAYPDGSTQLLQPSPGTQPRGPVLNVLNAAETNQSIQHMPHIR